MRKLAFIFIIVLLISVGCDDKSRSKELVGYDEEKVVNALPKLSFNPEIPNVLPFKPTETKVNVRNIGGIGNSLLEVLFKNGYQEEVTFRATIGENAIDFTEEEVKIRKNLKGRYGETENRKIMKWQKDNIYYELLVDNNSATKEEVIKIAKSFYQ
ncbi:hypothetical protein [Virgibacillus litoralis]|uniref:hypothetical protein n=1 Tax=Virgibacillus litoralis TaxID=578221 RepID=UPI001AEA6E29|nr:hypothetical protein [Virgibacillus litoralis]